MSGFAEWLNANSGAVGALSTALSAVFAAAAALAAFVTLGRASRRERCTIDVYMSPSMSVFDLTGSPEPAVQLTIHILGPAAPLSGTWDFDRRFGDSLPRNLAPGASEPLTLEQVAKCRDWCRVKISWLEPTGQKRRIRFWFRIQGDPNAPENSRKYLRIERDERATYLDGPKYLHRRPPVRAYIDWRIRKRKERQLWKLQDQWTKYQQAQRMRQI